MVLGGRSLWTMTPIGDRDTHMDSQLAKTRGSFWSGIFWWKIRIGWRVTSKRRSVLQGYELEYGQWGHKYTWFPCKRDTCDQTKNWFACIRASIECYAVVCSRCLGPVTHTRLGHRILGSGLATISCPKRIGKQERSISLICAMSIMHTLVFMSGSQHQHDITSWSTSGTHTRKGMVFVSFLVRPIQLWI